MDYKRIYNQIIERGKNRELPKHEYSESHHILPICLGGDDSKENLVNLTAREHFICHWLLVKTHQFNLVKYRKMLRAFSMMSRTSSNLVQRQVQITARRFEKYRKDFSESMRDSQMGSGNSQFGKRWISNPHTGESKKISSQHDIPEGWVLGRNLRIQKCIECGKDFVLTASVVCSHECAEQAKLKRPKVKRKSPMQTATRVKRNKFFSCVSCGNLFTCLPRNLRLTCSPECLHNHKTKDQFKPFSGREQEFLDYYKELGSMNKALKAMGFPGAVSHYYKWAKSLLPIS